MFQIPTGKNVYNIMNNTICLCLYLQQNKMYFKIKLLVTVNDLVNTKSNNDTSVGCRRGGVSDSFISNNFLRWFLVTINIWFFKEPL